MKKSEKGSDKRDVESQSHKSDLGIIWHLAVKEPKTIAFGCCQIVSKQKERDTWVCTYKKHSNKLTMKQMEFILTSSRSD